MAFRVLVDVALVCGGLAALVYLLQGKIIFPATRQVYRTPQTAFQWEFEDLRLPVGDHVTHGWFLPVENARGTVLFSHGNAGNIADRLESVGMFRRLNVNVLVYDYGGYGYSTGRPSEERSYADIRAMWRYLTEERGIPPEQIVLFGRSLGGGMTCELAAEVTPAGVVLESTFLSTRAMARKMIPWLPVAPLIRHRFDNEAKVSKFTSPLMVIHSPDDTLIPYDHGRRLFELAPEPKRFVEIHGDHNEGFVLSMDTWTDAVDAFIESTLGKPR